MYAKKWPARDISGMAQRHLFPVSLIQSNQLSVARARSLQFKQWGGGQAMGHTQSSGRATSRFVR